MHPLQYRKLLFNCVDAPPQEVASFIVERFSKPNPYDSGPPVAYHVEECECSWKDAYTDIPDPVWRPLVCILWEPKSRPGHSVFMSTRSDGMSFSVYKMSKASPHEWIHIGIGDQDSLPYPSATFRYYSQQNRRELAVAKDDRGKWEFVSNGSPCSFEDLSNYRKRSISERLTRDTIFHYLSELNYDVQSEEFWTPISSVKLWQEILEDPERC